MTDNTISDRPNPMTGISPPTLSGVNPALNNITNLASEKIDQGAQGLINKMPEFLRQPMTMLKDKGLNYGREAINRFGTGGIRQIQGLMEKNRGMQTLQQKPMPQMQGMQQEKKKTGWQKFVGGLGKVFNFTKPFLKMIPGVGALIP